MKLNPVGWFEIYVQDMPRAKAFYEGVFDTKLDKLQSDVPELWAFPMDMDMKTPGTSGALVKMPGVPSGGSTIVYFKCNDCATEVARVAPNGGRVHKEKFSIGQYGFIALAVDTEGNMFGMHSMK